jgi:hypothetical protein
LHSCTCNIVIIAGCSSCAWASKRVSGLPLLPGVYRAHSGVAFCQVPTLCRPSRHSQLLGQSYQGCANPRISVAAGCRVGCLLWAPASSVFVGLCNGCVGLAALCGRAAGGMYCDISCSPGAGLFSNGAPSWGCPAACSACSCPFIHLRSRGAHVADQRGGSLKLSSGESDERGRSCEHACNIAT